MTARRPLALFTAALATALALTFAFGASAAAQDRALDANTNAQLLAGIAPAPGDPVAERIVASAEWQHHRDWMQGRFSEVRKRLDAMKTWQQAELRPMPGSRRTLVYPFSGPDFLNAHTLFAEHSRYVFFSLEKPGSLPTLDALNERQLAVLLGDVRTAFADIFTRNYFITSYMSKQLTTAQLQGVVPIMAVMMALTDQRIVSIESFDPYPELTEAYQQPEANRPRKLLRAVRIAYADKNALAGQPVGVRTVEYYSLDATDRALRWYPDFLARISQQKPFTVFLKSASYLLHDQQFSQVRETLLTSSDLIVQDDTGIPYRLFAQADWKVKLMGTYAPPIKPLSYGAQPDLAAAYQALAPQPPLPFPFGYHWRDGKSGLLIAARVAH